MAAVGGNTKAEGDFLRGDRSFLLFGLGGSLHFAFPFQSDQAPTRIVHLRKIDGGRQDADPLSHTINLFHGSLLDPGRGWMDLPDIDLAIPMPLNSEIELIAE